VVHGVLLQKMIWVSSLRQRAGKLRHIRTVLQAETETCAAATEGAAALGLHRLVFESDCQTLNAMNNESYDLTWDPLSVKLEASALFLLNPMSLATVLVPVIKLHMN
jgi:hypothetical protein